MTPVHEMKEVACKSGKRSGSAFWEFGTRSRSTYLGPVWTRELDQLLCLAAHTHISVKPHCNGTAARGLKRGTNLHVSSVHWLTVTSSQPGSVSSASNDSATASASCIMMRKVSTSTAQHARRRTTSYGRRYDPGAVGVHAILLLARPVRHCP
eukprot:3871618-Rhodomonas_salina.1